MNQTKIFQLGKINKLKVARESEFGLFLQDLRGSEVLLPNAYVTPKMQVGTLVEVFLYHDSEDRLTATTLKPKALLDEFGVFEVVGMTNFGAFVDWGLPKDLFVPKKLQKEPFEIGKKVFLQVSYDQKTAHLIGTQKFTFDYEPKNYTKNKKTQAQIIAKTDLGYKCIVDNRYEGLLYANEVFKELQIGAKLVAYVKKRRPDGKLDLSLQAIGQKGSKKSQELFLQTLRKLGGKVALNSKSDPKTIQQTFGMSKKEFKKLLTLLQEKGVIVVDEKGTRVL